MADKRRTLMQVEKKSQQEARCRGNRKMQIIKGFCVPFDVCFDEAMENEEIKRYYEKGVYKRNSFVHKFIAPIHRF